MGLQCTEFEIVSKGLAWFKALGQVRAIALANQLLHENQPRVVKILEKFFYILKKHPMKSLVEYSYGEYGLTQGHLLN